MATRSVNFQYGESSPEHSREIKAREGILVAQWTNPNLLGYFLGSNLEREDSLINSVDIWVTPTPNVIKSRYVRELTHSLCHHVVRDIEEVPVAITAIENARKVHKAANPLELKIHKREVISETFSPSLKYVVSHQDDERLLRSLFFTPVMLMCPPEAGFEGAMLDKEIVDEHNKTYMEVVKSAERFFKAPTPLWNRLLINPNEPQREYVKLNPPLSFENLDAAVIKALGGHLGDSDRLQTEEGFEVLTPKASIQERHRPFSSDAEESTLFDDADFVEVEIPNGGEKVEGSSEKEVP